MKKYFLVATILFSVAIAANAQAPYNKAIGIKFPSGITATYKNFISDKSSIELQAGFLPDAFRVAGLYEFNFFNLGNIEGLGWYVGPGVHFQAYKNSYQKENNVKSEFGVDGIIGLDYKFNNLPINISADWQPSVALVGDSGGSVSNGGIAIRYTF